MSAEPHQKKSSTLFLRVKSRAFCCGASVVDGRIDKMETAPYLRRYAGMTYEVFRNMAREKGWDIEEKRE